MKHVRARPYDVLSSVCCTTSMSSRRHVSVSPPTSRFALLLTYPPSQPLLNRNNLCMPISMDEEEAAVQPEAGAGQRLTPPDSEDSNSCVSDCVSEEEDYCSYLEKRPRLSPPLTHTYRTADAYTFDPQQDPLEALTNYNKERCRLRRSQREDKKDALEVFESSDQLLYDFIEDQARMCTVYGDIETTTMIDSNTPINDMEISVASLLFVQDGADAKEKGYTLSFWNDDTLGLGAPLSFYVHALDHAKRIVFYNGKGFDLKVSSKLHRTRPGSLQNWLSCTFDPFDRLEKNDFGKCELDTLLLNNGLPRKSGSGKNAPTMYRDCIYEELQEYNRLDVELLRKLVELPFITVCDNKNTRVGTQLDESWYFDHVQTRKLTPQPPIPEGDTRLLVQGTQEWQTARLRLLTASNAGAALGVNGAFLQRQEVARRIRSRKAQGVVTHAMQRGSRLEPVARALYERIHNKKVAETGLHIHPQYPTQLAASPDGIVLKGDDPDNDPDNDPDTLLEIKVPESATTHTDTHFLTDAYFCQIQLAMRCTNLKKAEFVVMRALPEWRLQLQVTPVKLDESFCEYMESKLVKFHALAEKNEPPPDLGDELKDKLEEARNSSVHDALSRSVLCEDELVLDSWYSLQHPKYSRSS